MIFHTELIYLLKITDKNKIMILTGKAKEEFFNWLDNQGVNGIDISNWEFEKFHLLSNVSKNALIIEWLDSIGIYIIISPSDNPKNWFYTILGDDILSPFYQMYQSLDDFENRQEALTEAIKKANEIYNEKFEQ